MEEAGGEEKGCEARGWREQGPAEEEGVVPVCLGARPRAASTLLLLLLCCCTWLFISVPPALCYWLRGCRKACCQSPAGPG